MLGSRCTFALPLASAKNRARSAESSMRAKSQLVLIILVAADALAASPARLVNPLQPGPFAASSDVETFVARRSAEPPPPCHRAGASTALDA